MINRLLKYNNTKNKIVLIPLKRVVLVVITTPTKICGITLPVQFVYKYLVACVISEKVVIFKSSPETTLA